MKNKIISILMLLFFLFSLNLFSQDVKASTFTNFDESINVNLKWNENINYGDYTEFEEQTGLSVDYFVITGVIESGGVNYSGIQIDKDGISYKNSSFEKKYDHETLSWTSDNFRSFKIKSISSMQLSYEGEINDVVSGELPYDSLLNFINANTLKDEKYTITFNANGGTGTPPSSLEYSSGTRVELDLIGDNNLTKTGYTFVGWSAVPTTEGTYADEYIFMPSENITVYAVWAPAKYTIRFLNYDGTVLQTEELEYGAMPSYKGSTPVKPESEKYNYVFNGWEEDIVSVSGNKDYKAMFEEIWKSYKIRFLNYDGTVLQEENLSYGSTPSFKGTTPSKASTLEYSYTFNGWNKSITTVMSSCDYTATFTETKNKYTIRFLNHDGTILQTEELEYGAMPSYKGTTPSKASTNAYDFTFKSWDKTIANVTGICDYTATFNSIDRYYTIRFLNYDGTVLKTQQYKYGEFPSYTDMTNMQFRYVTDNIYSWYFYSGSNFDRTQLPKLYEIVGDSVFGFDFGCETGDGYIEVLFDELESYGRYGLPLGLNRKYKTNIFFPNFRLKIDGHYDYSGSAEIKIYRIAHIKLVDEEGNDFVTDIAYDFTQEEYQNEFLKLFSMVGCKKNDIPSKPNSDHSRFVFTGWGGVQPVTGDHDYTAVYKEKEFPEVRFVNLDGTILQSKYLDYGSDIVGVYDGEDPTYLENDPAFDYRFWGWDVYNGAGTEKVGLTSSVMVTPEYVNSDNVILVEAYYKTNRKYYKIRFLNYDGTVLKEYNYEYNVIPSFSGTTPSKPSTPEFSYSFSGWDKEITNVKEACDYTATFTETKNKYTIRFLNYDGTVLQTEELEYGAMPSYKGSTPVKPESEKCNYVFNGWEQDIVSVSENKDYKAMFEEVWKSYLIEFETNGGNSIESKRLTYGSYITGISNPVRTGYTFVGWSKYNNSRDVVDLSKEVVLSSKKYYAVWHATITVNINYLNENKIYFATKIAWRDGIDEIATITFKVNGVEVEGSITSWEHVNPKGTQEDDDFHLDEINKIKCTFTPSDLITYDITIFYLEFEVISDEETNLTYVFRLKKSSTNIELLKEVTIKYDWGTTFNENLLKQVISSNFTREYMIVSCSKMYNVGMNLDETIEVVLIYKTKFLFDLNGGHPNSTSLENGEVVDYIILITDYYINYNNDGTITYEPVYTLNPIRKNYIFKGWIDDSTKKVVIPSKITVTEALEYVSLTAKWESVKETETTPDFEDIINSNYTEDNSTASKNDSWNSILEKLKVGGKVEIIFEDNYLTYVFKEKNSKIVEKIRFENNLEFLKNKTIEDCFYMIVEDEGKKTIVMQYYLANNEFCLYYPLTGDYFTKNYITLYSRDIAFIKGESYNEYYLYFNSDIPVDKFTMLKFDYEYHFEKSGFFGSSTITKKGTHTILDDKCDLIYIANSSDWNSTKFWKKILDNSKNNFEEGTYSVNNNSYTYRMHFARQENKIDVGKRIIEFINPSIILLPYGVANTWLTFKNNEFMVFDSIDPIECSYILNGKEQLNVKVFDKVNVGKDENNSGIATDITVKVNPFNFVQFFKELVKLFKNFSLVGLLKLLRTYYGCTLVIVGIGFFGIRFYPIFKDVVKVLFAILLFIPKSLLKLLSRKR